MVSLDHVAEFSILPAALHVCVCVYVHLHFGVVCDIRVSVGIDSVWELSVCVPVYLSGYMACVPYL